MHALPDQHKPRLLAIDDSTMIHRLLRARLKNERLEIHCATSGSQGLKTAQLLLPDVILLDIEMPGMDGFTVLATLKGNPATHDIPVIFLSGACDSATVVRGLEMGAIDFIIKPFDIGELKARVRSAVRIRLLIKMLAQRAQVDGLTGLWNRAYFDHRLQEEIDGAVRHSDPLALIMCDVDHFKRINDTFGHPFGDEVLEEFGRIISAGRSADVPCRYGGEEFAVILPRCTAEEAMDAAERFRLILKASKWRNVHALTVTASFGVGDLTRASQPTMKAMVEMADAALYLAKQNGRDRVELARPQTPQTFELRRTA